MSYTVTAYYSGSKAGVQYGLDLVAQQHSSSLHTILAGKNISSSQRYDSKCDVTSRSWKLGTYDTDAQRFAEKLSQVPGVGYVQVIDNYGVEMLCRQENPLTAKGKTILAAMKREYGAKKGTQVFYASKNKGTITGVERSRENPMDWDAYDRALMNRWENEQRQKNLTVITFPPGAVDGYIRHAIEVGAGIRDRQYYYAETGSKVAFTPKQFTEYMDYLQYVLANQEYVSADEKAEVRKIYNLSLAQVKSSANPLTSGRACTDSQGRDYHFHTLKNGRHIYYRERISVLDPNSQGEPDGSRAIIHGTADFGCRDSGAGGTYLIFEDRWGNTHIPRDQDVLPTKENPLSSGVTLGLSALVAAGVAGLLYFITKPAAAASTPSSVPHVTLPTGKQFVMMIPNAADGTQATTQDAAAILKQLGIISTTPMKLVTSTATTLYVGATNLGAAYTAPGSPVPFVVSGGTNPGKTFNIEFMTVG